MFQGKTVLLSKQIENLNEITATIKPSGNSRAEKHNN